MPQNYFTTVFVRKSNASASTDQQIMKLGEPLAKKGGVKINITPTELQLVFLNGQPDKETENYAAANLRAQIERKNLMDDWKPAEPRY